MPLVTTLLLQLTATLAKALDLVTGSAPLSYSLTTSLATGTGANQADKIFSDERTLTTGATEDLDLAGVLADAFGDVITLARVKLLLIVADPTNTTNLTIGNGVNPWVAPFGATGTVVLKPGEFCVFGSPGATAWAVTAGTGDILKVANAAGASAKYKVVIIGASA